MLPKKNIYKKLSHELSFEQIDRNQNTGDEKSWQGGTCRYCGKKITGRTTVPQHEQVCEKNPNNNND